MVKQAMNEEKKHLKERAGNSGHVIPHFDGTVPSPYSLSPEILAKTQGTHSRWRISRVALCELTVAEETCRELPISEA